MNGMSSSRSPRLKSLIARLLAGFSSGQDGATLNPTALTALAGTASGAPTMLMKPAVGDKCAHMEQLVKSELLRRAMEIKMAAPAASRRTSGS